MVNLYGDVSVMKLKTKWSSVVKAASNTAVDKTARMRRRVN